MKELIIIGGGLAGSEAAWQASLKGIKVTLYEMRKSNIKTHAHSTQTLAELVCSNSFRNDDITSAIGLLHEEMRLCNSLILRAADKFKLPAGSALAVDRHEFSNFIQEQILAQPNITIKSDEIISLPKEDKNYCLIATGPLTSENLTQDILKITGEEQLAFFDAIAPIIYKESINFDIAWFQSRYNKSGPGGTGQDYINCPLSKDQYYNFIDALIHGEKTEFKDWEKNTPYFEGCLPIEVMAERGRETLAFGPMKPVGLDNPYGEKPYAVVQLRQDNKLGTLYNMVGFQTKLKYGAQKDIFKMIPGLENAEFARLGGIHRNTFIKSPKLLDKTLNLKNAPHIHFAGQITGVEGYVESAAIGLLAGRFITKKIMNQNIITPPAETALGSLLNHITENANIDNFQPMNINFGLFPGIKAKKHERATIRSENAIKLIKEWID